MSAPDGIPAVPAADVPESDDVLLLDVREQDEWEIGHAPGALHIPLGELPGRVDEIDLDRDLYVLCRGGGRSEKAVRYLETVGYEAVLVDGGMIAWASAERPVVTGDGAVGGVK
ncbi:rhodanese-like domain-containing protein [Tsukamurella sp. 8J]|uniref:rhodanese-like domain-containing protein n=1 Tax=Tsukamurella sp. 8J TaxID=3031962 RepID=UPI0023B8D9DF|nr:rhodanese-like domain-containing protein [Tsukamurella sp. 8J]MDF0532583.1 rhodanese-like domain-containing protein [Tsukamurella sp. 8J]